MAAVDHGEPATVTKKKFRLPGLKTDYIGWREHKKDQKDHHYCSCKIRKFCNLGDNCFFVKNPQFICEGFKAFYTYYIPSLTTEVNRLCCQDFNTWVVKQAAKIAAFRRQGSPKDKNLWSKVDDCRPISVGDNICCNQYCFDRETPGTYHVFSGRPSHKLCLKCFGTDPVREEDTCDTCGLNAADEN